MHLDFDPIAKVSGGDFIERDFEFDDSERNFLQELTDAIPEESKLDSSKAVGARSMRDEEDEEDDDLEREEAKEEEYDYFLDAQNDENANAAHGYHIIDENDL